jgi:hypothetical protein
VVREGVGAGGEMTQALYAHMNNKRKKKKFAEPAFEYMNICALIMTFIMRFGDFYQRMGSSWSI